METENVEFENRLRSRRGVGVTIEFRSRVMRAVECELAGSQIPAPVHEWNFRSWGAVAVAAMILLNLSVVFSTCDGFAVHRGDPPHRTISEVQAIHQIEAQQERMFQ
jgi:hypothetical protein